MAWEALMAASLADYKAELAKRQPRPSNRYSRAVALGKLGFLTSAQIADHSRFGRRDVLVSMERALKREIKKRDARAWNYNRNRHQHLIDTHKRELAAYEAVADVTWRAAA